MRTLNLFLFIIVLGLSLLVSCKKDDDSTPDYFSSLSGGWKYVKGSQDEKYFQIYKNKTFSILYSDNQGIRDRIDGTLLVTGNQILIDKLNNYNEVDVFNYSLEGDTLKLSQLSETTTLVRDKNSPDTNQWIKTIVAVARTKAPVDELTDITYDGSYIWYGNGYSSEYLYKINPTNFAVDSIHVSVSAWAVEADDTTLWASDDGGDKIYQMGNSTGNTLFTSGPAMGAWIYGITKDNDFLWCYSNNENKLYKYNITANTVDLTTDISDSWAGLAMVNGYLYAASNGKLNKCTLSPLIGVASFQLPGYYIYGVAYDGDSFWVSASKNDQEWPEIIKVSGVD